jgi:succinate dehydrogenase flavin-adding protein (antitoxin of CptAB toxin-antitoxin module)
MRDTKSSPRTEGGIVREQANQAMLLAIHIRLLAAENGAREALVRVMLEPLVEELVRRLRRVDEHLIRDGVVDALLDFCARPKQYDAEQGVPWDRFLAVAARRNVDDHLRSESRRKRREEKVGRGKKEADVALDPAAANIIQEVNEQQSQKNQELLDLLSDPKDREFLFLKMQGERKAEVFARVLEITHLSMDAQRKEIKRRKDRIQHFVKRHAILPERTDQRKP